MLVYGLCHNKSTFCADMSITQFLHHDITAAGGGISTKERVYRKVAQFHYISDVTFSFVCLTPPFCRELLLPSSRDKTLRSCRLLLCVDIPIQLNNLYLSNYVTTARSVNLACKSIIFLVVSGRLHFDETT